MNYKNLIKAVETNKNLIPMIIGVVIFLFVAKIFNITGFENLTWDIVIFLSIEYIISYFLFVFGYYFYYNHKDNKKENNY